MRFHFTNKFCEAHWRHSVKTRLYNTPPPYSIVLASSVKTKEVVVIEFHKIYIYLKLQKLSGDFWNLKHEVRSLKLQFRMAAKKLLREILINLS